MADATRKVDYSTAWHITIATDRLQENMERFWNDFGIGPWQIVSFRCPDGGIRLNGRPSALDVEAAATDVGFLMIGYDRPRLKPSPYDNVLDRRHSGGHHIALWVNNYREACQHMRDLGYAEILGADALGQDGDGAGVYFDTIEDMGTIIEFSTPPSRMPELDRTFPAEPAAASPGDLGIRETLDVVIAVRDVDHAVRCYETVLGVTPWKVTTRDAKARYRGQPIDYAVKRATAKIGSYTVALEQQLSDQGPLGDFIAVNGQGLHRVCFVVEDVDVAADEIRERGYAELLSFPGTGPDGDGRSICIASEDAVGIVIELVEMPAWDSRAT